MIKKEYNKNEINEDKKEEIKVDNKEKQSQIK